jgi:hypothetical protein
MKPTIIMRAAGAVLCAALAFAVHAKPNAAAPAAAASPNDTCLMCHSAADAKGPDGRSIAVDGAKFATSVHGSVNLKCTDCHTDASADKIPHADKLKPVNCASCHDKAVKEYGATVHATSRKGGNTVAATCIDCHGKHDILRAKDPASRTSHANVEATCSRCHGDEATMVKGKLPNGNVAGKFHDSIHGKALQGAARGSAPTCTNCHGAHSILAKSNEGSRTHRAQVVATCGTCHEAEREAWTKGMHGKLQQAGMLAAPECADCHSAHSIQQHDKPTFQTAVIDQCGNCHSEYLSTYRDTFHGQVTALGYAQMATCASCHGAHEVLPASNPASKVSKQNRLATCQKCHAKAGPNFASFDPHASRHDKARDPFYYYAAKFMELLLLGVFSFFGVHTVFWLYREVREKFGSGRRDERQ